MITMPAVFVYGGCGGTTPKETSPSHALDRKVQKYLLARAKADWASMSKIGTLQAYEMTMLANYMLAEITKNKHSNRPLINPPITPIGY
jgi:hypothetical protein